MLKSILILGTSLITLTTYSQFERGVKQIGFTTVFSGAKSKTNGLTGNLLYFKVAPSFSYFVKDNFSIGGTFLFSTSQSIQKINNNSNGNKSLTYGFGFTMNKYFKLKENFYFTVNSMVSFSNYSSQIINSNSSPISKSNILGGTIAPGLVYLLTPKIGLTATFGSLYYTYMQPVGIASSSTSSSNFGANFGFSSLNFGLIFNFKSKME